MLTQELSHGVRLWKSGSKERLQQMFPASSDEKVDGMKSFSESYHKYKRNYVKNLFFNPDNNNLSRCFAMFAMSQFLFIFSDCTGAFTTTGGVHLL